MTIEPNSYGAKAICIPIWSYAVSFYSIRFFYFAVVYVCKEDGNNASLTHINHNNSSLLLVAVVAMAHNFEIGHIVCARKHYAIYVGSPNCGTQTHTPYTHNNKTM